MSITNDKRNTMNSLELAAMLDVKHSEVIDAFDMFDDQFKKDHSKKVIECRGVISKVVYYLNDMSDSIIVLICHHLGRLHKVDEILEEKYNQIFLNSNS